MTLEEIARLLASVEACDVSEATVSLAGCTLSLRRVEPAGADAPAVTPPAPGAPVLRAQAAGVFRASHPAHPAAAAAGRDVAAGEVVGFLQVGPCLRPVVAPEAGRIGPPLAEEGALVGFGTALFATVGGDP